MGHAMTTDAIIEIGSVAKQLAAAVVKLRDEGKIGLDADITKYLPGATLAHRIPLRGPVHI